MVGGTSVLNAVALRDAPHAMYVNLLGEAAEKPGSVDVYTRSILEGHADTITWRCPGGACACCAYKGLAPAAEPGAHTHTEKYTVVMVSDGKSTTLQHQLESDSCACCSHKINKAGNNARLTDPGGCAAKYTPVPMSAHKDAASKYRAALAVFRARKPGGTFEEFRESPEAATARQHALDTCGIHASKGPSALSVLSHHYPVCVCMLHCQ